MAESTRIDLQQFRKLLQMIVGYERKNGKPTLTNAKFVRSAMTKHLKETYYFQNDGRGTVHIYTKGGGKIDTMTEEELIKTWEK